MSRRALTIESQPHRRAYMFSDWNIFKHDLPRGHTDSQGWARPEVVRGGAEQRCACLAALGGKTWEPCLCFGASIAGGRGKPLPRTPPSPANAPATGVGAMLMFWGSIAGGACPPLPGKRVRSTPQSWCQKWLNSEKTVSGHVKKKKNASPEISETSRAAHLYVPPAPCHVPPRPLKIRRRYAAPKSAGRSAAC